MAMSSKKTKEKVKELKRWIQYPRRQIYQHFIGRKVEKGLNAAVKKALQKEAIQPPNFSAHSSIYEPDLVWPWNLTPPALGSVMPDGVPWPKISIITPSYNQGEFIEETIRSVLNQGYPNLEYIVIDGGSTDQTQTILNRYRDELTVCLSEPDRGQADALNKGFAYATGDILAWLNSDDLYLPDTLAKIAVAFSRHGSDVIAGNILGFSDHVRKPSTQHANVLPINQNLPFPTDLTDFYGVWQKGHYFFQPEVFFTRELWEQTGAHVRAQLYYSMDYELWLRFAEFRAIICHIPENLALFRFHEKQKTKFGNSTDHSEHLALAREYREKYGLPTLKNLQPSTSVPVVAAPTSSMSRLDPDAYDIRDTLPPSPFAHHPIDYYKTDIGNYYLPADAPYDVIINHMKEGQVFEPEIVEIASQYIRPGSLVLDIGANFGQMSIIFSKMTGKKGQVFAFEADDFVFDILQRNLQANRVQNVRAFFGAVFDRSETEVSYPEQDFKRFSAYGSYGLNLNAKNGRKVPTLTIDELDIQTPISFMKVDVQGSDLFVLRGAINTIRRHRMPIIFEFEQQFQYEFGTSLQAYFDFVAEIDYHVAKTVNHINYVLLPNEYDPTLPLRDISVQSVGGNQPAIRLTQPAFRNQLCKFLKTRQEVDICTAFLKRNGFVSHNLVCKDWDLAHIIPEIGDGNFLDMGSSDSYILKNLHLKRIAGELHGIDLGEPDVIVPGVKYHKGDLMHTDLPSAHFRNISCLSVLEHQVDYHLFASEVSRLLQEDGRLYVTFDYWDPKIKPPIKLYDLEWQPLDQSMTRQFIAACHQQGLHIVQDMDWVIDEPVIQWGYYAPHPKMAYTFGMAVFEKRSSAL